MIPYEEIWQESNQDPDLFYDLIVEYEINERYILSKIRPSRTTKVYAIEVFKSYLPILIDVKKKYDKENIEHWEKLERIIENKEKIRVEEARNVTVERLLDFMNIDHSRGRSYTPLVSGATNNTAFRFKDNFWKCYRTDEKGDTIALCQKLTGRNFVDCVNLLNSL